MMDQTLRPTIRRAVAVLLVPLATLVVLFAFFLRHAHGLVDAAVVNVSQLGGGLLVLLAVGYLLVSGIAALLR